MKNPELFHKTIGILVNTYMKGTLQHSEPCGCAIGNLIAANNNYRIVKIENPELFDLQLEFLNSDNKIVEPNWICVHAYGKLKVYSGRPTLEYRQGKLELLSTGYVVEETLLIENAFEGVKDRELDNDGYRGLMAVVDVLIQIHEGSESEANETKKLFNKELVYESTL